MAWRCRVNRLVCGIDADGAMHGTSTTGPCPTDVVSVAVKTKMRRGADEAPFFITSYPLPSAGLNSPNRHQVQLDH